MREFFDKVREINAKGGDFITPERVLNKLTEETGEMSQALSWYTGFKDTDMTKEEILDNMSEESVDALINIFSLLDLLGIGYDDMIKWFGPKLDKWDNKLNTLLECQK